MHFTREFLIAFTWRRGMTLFKFGSICTPGRFLGLYDCNSLVGCNTHWHVLRPQCLALAMYSSVVAICWPTGIGTFHTMMCQIQMNFFNISSFDVIPVTYMTLIVHDKSSRCGAIPR